MRLCFPTNKPIDRGEIFAFLWIKITRLELEFGSPIFNSKLLSITTLITIYSCWFSQAVTHLGTEQVCRCLTSVIVPEPMFQPAITEKIGLVKWTFRKDFMHEAWRNNEFKLESVLRKIVNIYEHLFVFCFFLSSNT